jgi:hypothetical protein
VSGPESSAVGVLAKSQSPFDPDGRAYFRRRVLAKAVHYNELLLKHLRSRLEEAPRLRAEPSAARSGAPRPPTAGAPRPPTAGAPNGASPPRTAPGPTNGTRAPKDAPSLSPTNGTPEPNARTAKPAPKAAPPPGPENGGTPSAPSGHALSPWIPRPVQEAAAAKASESPWLPPGLRAPSDLGEGGTKGAEETVKPRKGPPVHPLDLAPAVVAPRIANGHDRHEAPRAPLSEPRDEIGRILGRIRVPAAGVAVALVLLASVASGAALVLDPSREPVSRPTVRQAALPAVPVASVPLRRHHRRHRRHVRLPKITVPASLEATGSSPSVP